MSEHMHEWDELWEEGLAFPPFRTGFRCATCGMVPQDVTPVGVGGRMSGRRILRGPHGGYGNCADGSAYKEQIAHPDGRLEIVR